MSDLYLHAFERKCSWVVKMSCNVMRITTTKQILMNIYKNNNKKKLYLNYYAHDPNKHKCMLLHIHMIICVKVSWL